MLAFGYQKLTINPQIVNWLYLKLTHSWGFNMPKKGLQFNIMESSYTIYSLLVSILFNNSSLIQRKELDKLKKKRRFERKHYEAKKGYLHWVYFKLRVLSRFIASSERFCDIFVVVERAKVRIQIYRTFLLHIIRRFKI